jgi:hypothetical protein
MNNNNNFGFIMTRHVNSEKTNNYWNNSIRCIRRFYTDIKIIVIDDNSNYDFVKADYQYKNVEIIQSEYKGRGELLPYYYFFKNKYFDNAVIIHDSVFIHKKINFDVINGFDVLPLWHFNPDKENVLNSLRLISNFKNAFLLNRNLMLSDDNIMILGRKPEWYGCFGVQSYINHNFLCKIVNKYDLFTLLDKVNSRPDRCCLERIFGLIFNLESCTTKKHKSLFGSIHNYDSSFKYTYDNYTHDLTFKQKLPKHIIKVWSGR